MYRAVMEKGMTVAKCAVLDNLASRKHVSVDIVI